MATRCSTIHFSYTALCLSILPSFLLSVLPSFLPSSFPSSVVNLCQSSFLRPYASSKFVSFPTNTFINNFIIFIFYFSFYIANGFRNDWNRGYRFLHYVLGAATVMLLCYLDLSYCFYASLPNTGNLEG